MIGFCEGLMINMFKLKSIEGRDKRATILQTTSIHMYEVDVLKGPINDEPALIQIMA